MPATVTEPHVSAPATSAVPAPAHTGRLIRKLALVFLVFAAVAVVLNCALTYVNTRDTYLQAQADRLRQIGTYAATSSSGTADVTGYYADWVAADRIDPARTVEEQSAAATEAYTLYASEYERLAEGVDELPADDEAYLDGLYEQYAFENTLTQYYSLADMLDRLKRYFEVESLALVIPDAQTHEVRYVAEAVGEGQTRGQGGIHAFGDVEARDADGYPRLWATVETGAVQDGVELSPDGSLYTVYVPLTAVDGTLWLCEVSISTSAFAAAVLSQMLGTVAVSCVVFALCLAGIVVALRRSLVRPIVQLSGQVRRYAADKSPQVALDIRAGGYPADEVGDLAGNVADMIDELRQHMDDIARMSAERERVRSELAVARRIQLSALPAVQPPFTGEDGGAFALSASMNPAREVGGDFYDFFMVDATRCAVVVADVSGKGVPAALFMMRAKALLRQLLAEGLPPEQAMARANEGLSADNEENMFVTVWLGVLDTATGELHFANGGHNPAVYRGADGSVTWLRERSGLLLGGFAGAPYKGFARTMAPGDVLVLYTDGVTEAMDPGQHCYGNDRLEHLVAGLADGTAEDPAAVVEAVQADVRAFADGAEQADDITLLVLRFRGDAGAR